MKIEYTTKFNKVPIADITPFTLLDYPAHTACVLWFKGCNLRCHYCYNIDLVMGKGQNYNFKNLVKFLDKRKNKLDAVVFSGGECTLYKDLLELVNFVKSMGYLVKIDTNGINTKKIERLINSKMVDYVALDYKAPKEQYKKIVGKDVGHLVYQTLLQLVESGINFEVRTTVHSALLSELDIITIIQELQKAKFKGKYFLQGFKHGPTLGNLSKEKEMIDFCSIQNQYQEFPIYLRNL